MFTYEEPTSYKAEVHISGAVTQKVYGRNLDKVRERSIRTLTRYKPGFGCTTPKHVLLFKSVRCISGNRTQWAQIESVPYKLLREDQHEWRQEQKRRETALRMNPV